MLSAYHLSANAGLAWQYIFGNVVLFLYIATSIFYVFPSGSPQPADWLMVLGLGVAFISFLQKKNKTISKLAFIAFSFALYAFAINLINFFFMLDIAFLKSSFYYVYNAAIMLFIVWLAQKNIQLAGKSIYYGLIVAVIIELISIEFFPSFRGIRHTGTFHNPNQLAMWSLFAMCFLIILRKQSKFNLMDYFLILGLAYIQTLSLSKAGLICFCLLGVSLLFTRSMSNYVKFCLLCSLVVLTAFSFHNAHVIKTFSNNYENIKNTYLRFENIGKESDDSLAGRHYTRIFNNPEYTLIGAGEGGYMRFGDTMKNQEIHSGLGTILFSYGVVGVGLFCFVLYAVSRGAGLHAAFIIFVLMLHGLTHQNVRFTHFWVFLGMMYSLRYLPAMGVEGKFKGLQLRMQNLRINRPAVSPAQPTDTVAT